MAQCWAGFVKIHPGSRIKIQNLSRDRGGRSEVAEVPQVILVVPRDAGHCSVGEHFHAHILCSVCKAGTGWRGNGPSETVTEII